MATLPSAAVTVCCRVRPRVPKADLPSGFDALTHDERSVQPRDRGTYTFDAVFGPSATQVDIFQRVARPLIDAALNGINATIMCYGQTGSGKTHTLTGGEGEDRGIAPRVVEHLFKCIEEAPDTVEFTLRVSYLEIYMERVRDLLKPDAMNLAIRQDAVRGIFVEGAREEYVASANELLSILQIGEGNRAVGATGMNDASSRSHSVVQVTMQVRDTVGGSLQMSKLCLVDLAGSESVSRTGAEGLVLDEARMINKSLFNLAKCINTLATMGEAAAAGGSGGSGDASDAASSVAGGRRAMPLHIPYRDSKLTRLLQDSLGGNARMALVVCCSPCSSNLTETVSTLRFGARAKHMTNRPIVNRVRSIEELERLLAKAEIAIDAQAGFIQVLQTQIMELMERLDAIEGQGGDGSDDDSQEAMSPTLARSGGGGGDGGEDVHAAHSSPVALYPAAQPAAGAAGGGGVACEGERRARASLPPLPLHGPHSPAPAASPPFGNQHDRPGPLPSFSDSGLGKAVAGGGVAGLGSARDSTRGSRRGSMGTAYALDAAAVTQLMELSSLREEVAELRRGRQVDAGELMAREEEVRSLTAQLTAKQSHLEAMQAAKEADVKRAHETGLADAMESTVNQLRRFACATCHTQPFADLVDVSGLIPLHEHTCFELTEARAALTRVEERATVLQGEVNDLKAFIAHHHHDHRGSREGVDGDEKRQGEGETGPPPALPGEAAPPGTDVDVAAPMPMPVKREVVDVKVVVDLQSKLTALIHVHRQLLRKFAVVDVECGEMVEGLRARDARIADLVKASLSHNAAMHAMQQRYEDEVEGMRREYVAQLQQMRADLLSVASLARPSTHSGRASPVPLASSTTTTSPSPGSLGATAWVEEPGVAGGAGLAALRHRHIVKPLRGHGSTIVPPSQRASVSMPVPEESGGDTSTAPIQVHTGEVGAGAQPGPDAVGKPTPTPPALHDPSTPASTRLQALFAVSALG